MIPQEAMDRALDAWLQLLEMEERVRCVLRQRMLTRQPKIRVGAYADWLVSWLCLSRRRV